MSLPAGGGGGGGGPPPSGGGLPPAANAAASGTTRSKLDFSGGRFDFDDGGTYCGGWEDGKAHGHGVCTGPKGQGEYAGSWHFGFEVSGVYTWPSGSTFEGHWANGKRHGLGVEARGRWLYRGEWTQGFKGRYGVRQSTVSGAKYEGTWANGLQDGYGSETYADGGTYQGQWLRGLRHGYGVRTSAPYGIASHFRGQHGNMRGSEGSLNQAGTTTVTGASAASSGIGIGGTNSATNTLSRPGAAGAAAAGQQQGPADETRGGFVLRTKSDQLPMRRRSLVEKSGMKGFVQKLKKQRSTGDLDRKGVTSIRSTGSTTSWMSTESGYTAGAASMMSEGSNASFMMEDEQLDANVTETYMGEWKMDKRCGFGISERSDGLKYEGEWYNNRKYGYGVTTFRDGTKEEGKYKNNILITSNQKRHLFLIRSAKFRERMDSALNAATRASKIALQKADIAISRTATSRGKAEQADIAAMHAREDGQAAQVCSKQYASEVGLADQEQAMAAAGMTSAAATGGGGGRVAPDSKQSWAANKAGLQAHSRTPVPSPSHQQQQLQNKPLSSNVQGTASTNPTMNAAAAAPSWQQQPATASKTGAMAKTSGSGGGLMQMASAAGAQRQQQQPQPGGGLQNQSGTFQQQQQPLGGGGAAFSKLSSSSAVDSSSRPSAAAASAAAASSPLSKPSPSEYTTKPSSSMSIPSAASNFSPGGKPPPEPSMPSSSPLSALLQPQPPRPTTPSGPGLGGGGGQLRDNRHFAPAPAPASSSMQAASSSRNANYNNCDILGPASLAEAPDSGVGAAGVGRRGGGGGGGPMGRYGQTNGGGSGSSALDDSGRRSAFQSVSGGGASAGGGYNFQRIMDDHFEHYRRPPSRPTSREQSVDRQPGGLGLATDPSGTGRLSRPASRNSSSRRAADDFALGKANGGLSRDPSASSGTFGVRQRQTSGTRVAVDQLQPTSVVGAIPKRTESLYMKIPEAGDSPDAFALQRKKSLPDVQNLVGVTSSQGSKEMTREEISVLSSSRRENVRKQMEEIERYKSNPIMYIINPRVQEWISRQQLLLLVFFLNLSLAFMFFKLLT